MNTTMPPRPATMPLNADGLPDDRIMREARFVVWGWTWNAGKGKWDKPPLRPLDGRAASVTNAADHTDLARAIFAVRAHGFDGVGLVLEKGLGVVGIDLDKCRDATTGVIESWAQAIIDRFRSYWEPSASGTGIRIFVRGQLPPTGRRKGQIEVYEDGRYLTINGNPGPGASRHFEERQAELDAWHAETFGVQQPKGDRPIAPIPVTLDDTTLLEKAFAAKNGRDFERRHQGVLLLENTSDDDWAYLMALAFWTQCNPGQMRRIALASGRVRDKWLSRRPGGDWLDYNITNACTEQHEVYDSQRLSGSRVVFTVPDDGDVCDVAQIAAAVAARDGVIVRLEAEVERLTAQLTNCRQEHLRKDATIENLDLELRAYKAAAAFPDQTMGGAVWDVANGAFAERERGNVLVEDGKEQARVCYQTAADLRSCATVGNATKKFVAAGAVDGTFRKIDVETEAFKGKVQAAYIEIPPECDTPAKFVLHLLKSPVEKKHGGARRKVELPEFDEPVAGPVKCVTEKRKLWSDLTTEKVVKVERVDSHTEHFDADGYQMTAAEVDEFNVSIGKKVKTPAYRPTVQQTSSPEDIELTTIPRANLDDDPRRPIPLHGSCAWPGCPFPAQKNADNTPKDLPLCSRHTATHGYSMTGAD
jgi:hypothetical protein